MYISLYAVKCSFRGEDRKLHFTSLRLEYVKTCENPCSGNQSSMAKQLILSVATVNVLEQHADTFRVLERSNQVHLRIDTLQCSIYMLCCLYHLLNTRKKS